MAREASGDPFFEQVREYFGYLVEEYGFSIVAQERLPSADFAYIIFQSESCRIRIMREWGDVLVNISPPSPLDYWIFLEEVILYLSQETEDVRAFRAHAPREMDYEAKVKWQLEILATLLRPYTVKMCKLFGSKDFQQKSVEIKATAQKDKRK